MKPVLKTGEHRSKLHIYCFYELPGRPARGHPEDLFARNRFSPHTDLWYNTVSEEIFP
jgi:hypothetical protein